MSGKIRAMLGSSTSTLLPGGGGVSVPNSYWSVSPRFRTRRTTRMEKGRSAQRNPFISAPDLELLEAFEIGDGDGGAQRLQDAIEVRARQRPVRRLADRLEERLFRGLPA